MSTFLNKLSPAQQAYFKKASIHLQTVGPKVKILAYEDTDCCFKGRGPGVSLVDGRMLVGQLFELLGGREGVNTCIPKQTYIPVICQDVRAHVCVFVCVCRVSGNPFPPS